MTEYNNPFSSSCVATHLVITPYRRRQKYFYNKCTLERKAMQSFTKVGIVLTFFSLIQSGYSQRCSWSEYAFTMSLCWMPYSMDLAIRMTTAASRAARPSEYIEAFKGSCGRRLYDAIECHGRVDKFCGVQLMDTELFENTVDKLCQNIDDLMTLGTCATTYVTPFLGCLSTINYDGDLCRMTASFQACLNSLLDDGGCNKNVKDFMSSAQEVSFLAKCLPNPPNRDSNLPPCTAVATMTTSGLCWTSFIVKMVSTAVQKGDLMSTFQSICNSGEIRTIIECQAAVNDQCNTPLVNTQEFATFADTICKSFKDFPEFAKCVNQTKAVELGKCTAGIELKNGQGHICTASNDFQQCFDALVRECKDDLKTVTRQGYDVVSLSCPSSLNGPKCTMMEHAYTLGTCWLPTVQVMIPWPWQNQSTYDIRQRLTDLCGKHRSSIENSIACHVEADNRCNRIMIKGTVLTAMAKEMCREVTGLLDLPKCIDGRSTQEYYVCLLPIQSYDVSGPGYFCKAKTQLSTCMKKLFDRCDGSLKTNMNAILDISLSTVNCDEIRKVRETTTPAAATVQRFSLTTTSVFLVFVAAQIYI